MRVLLIDVFCKRGSTGKIVYDLYRELNNCGHVASICYGRGARIKEPDIIRISTKLEVYLHALLSRITGLNAIFSPFATRKLLKYMKNFKPDIVHIHDPKTYYMNIKPLVEYLKKEKIKTIWTFHSEYMYTGKCGYAYDCEKWKTQCKHCPDRRGYPKSLFFDFTKKMYHDKKNMLLVFQNLIIVAPSKWLLDRIKQSFLKDKTLCMIHNGIDVEQVFHPRKYDHLIKKHMLKDEKIILSVAPDLMSPRKGGRWIIALAKRFEHDPRIKFILIGIEDLRDSFPSNVIALGKIEDQTELAAYYSLADAFLICSEKENFPTTCLEALSCGTPVIGFDTGGTKETAPDGYGIFVPYKDLRSLYATLVDVVDGKTNLRSPEECAAYGLLHYDKTIMCQKYLELYQSK